MRNTLLLLSLFIFINTHLFSQNSDLATHRFVDDVRFGGGINIGVGNSYSTFAISPSVIYDFSEQFSAGISGTYVYVKNKSTINSTTNLFGGSVLALYRPIHYIQMSTEFENLKINQKLNYDQAISNWQTALYFGLEYVTGNIAMGLRYDVLYDKVKNITNSSALNPIFRVYF